MSIEKDLYRQHQESLLRGFGRKDEIEDLSIEEDIITNVIQPLNADQQREFRERLVPIVTNVANIANENQTEEFDQAIVDDIEYAAQSFSSYSNMVNEATKVLDATNIYYESEGVDNNLKWADTILLNSIKTKSEMQNGLEWLADALAKIVEGIPKVTGVILGAVSVVGKGVGIVAGGISGAVSWVGSGVKGLFSGKGLDGFNKEAFNEGFDAMGWVSDLVDGIAGMTQQAITSYSNWLSGTIREVMGGGYSDNYQDGVSETKFGQKQEDSWRRFVNNSISQNKIRFVEATPVSDWGTDPILFGAPPRYTPLSDPRDRAYMNTFIKDGNIISLIPGKPKYNGLNLSRESTATTGTEWTSKIKAMSKFNEAVSDNFTGTEDLTAQEYSNIALDYLKTNGISETFNEYDKRYYTFETDLESYYSYLETMLNTLYTRMGLGEGEAQVNDMFTFFNNPGSDQESLKSKYNGKSIGFYMEGNPMVSEGVSSSTGDPAGLKSTADALSDTFQAQNYVTGFGVNKARNAGVFVTKLGAAIDSAGSALGSGSGLLTKATQLTPGDNKPGMIAKIGGGLLKVGDTALHLMKFSSENDLNALTQQLMTTNGMKTQFPNLWTDSGYNKSVTVDFEFVSPYGDPLSIFQHVYTPLAALLAMALPKQAAENGYVNPFFLRMDIPGVISSDFSMISSITWIRGGQNNLWTTDRHPRAITVSVTFEDLYEYLAMTRRVSYLAANPNYSMFLDSFSGVRSLYNEGSTINNDYWTLLVNRLNSNLSFTSDMWNANSVDKAINRHVNDTSFERQNFFTNYYKRDLSWMKPR